MENKELLKIFNIKDKRIELTQVKEDYLKGRRINKLYGNLTYSVDKCIDCNSKTLVKNGYDLVKIQLSNIGDKATYLLLNKQRYLCRDCRRCFTISCKDCTKHNRKSNILKSNIDYLLMKNKISQKEISTITNVSTSLVAKRLNTHIKRIRVDKKNLPEVLCIDELNGVASDKGKYNCVIYDYNNKNVKDVVITRRQNTLENYFRSYTKEARLNVKYFITDMYNPYILLCKKLLPNAKIVLDRFHIINLLIRMIDNIRIAEMKKYNKSSLEYRALKKFNKKLKKRSKDISIEYKKLKHYPEFKTEYDILIYLLSLSKDLEQAYYLLQAVFTAYDNNSLEEFNQILEQEEQYSNNSTIYTCFKTLKRYREYIVNSIIYPYSNGPLESANAKIKQLKRNAYGYRNFYNFRARIFMIFNYLKEEKDNVEVLNKTQKLKAG